MNCQDESVKALVFSGSFKNETFDEAVKYMQETVAFQFKYKIENDNQVIIYK